MMIHADSDIFTFRWHENGKSTLMAFIGLYVIVCDGENGAEIYSAATKKTKHELYSMRLRI